MARILPLQPSDADEATRAGMQKIIDTHGRITNMKATLAHSPAAMKGLMAWYPLRDQVASFLGERATNLFVHSVSTATDCLICSTFFRRILAESGEDPDCLQLDEREQAVVDFGQQLVHDANGVSDELYGRLERFFEPSQIIELTVLGGLMIATNIFNNAVQVDLDEYLEPYRRDVEARR